MFRKSVVTAMLLILLVARPATAQQYPIEEPRLPETPVVAPPDVVDDRVDNVGKAGKGGKGDGKVAAAGKGQKLPKTGASSVDQLMRVAVILLVAGFALHQSGRYRRLGAGEDDPSGRTIRAHSAS